MEEREDITWILSLISKIIFVGTFCGYYFYDIKICYDLMYIFGWIGIFVQAVLIFSANLLYVFCFDFVQKHIDMKDKQWYIKNDDVIEELFEILSTILHFYIFCLCGFTAIAWAIVIFKAINECLIFYINKKQNDV